MNAETTLVEAPEPSVHAARILVVEDERIVARSLRKQLTALGYDVIAQAPSGEEAIQLTEEFLPDLVLMDISLEGPMDGVEAAATIRKRFGFPVVYLTAFSNKEILERARVTEPFGYILKPYEERELHVVIEMALYKHRMERRQQEREQWFAATLRSIGDAVIATDDDGHITYMNPLAERLTCWTVQDALGQALHEVVRLVHEESRQPVEAPLDQAMQGGTPANGIVLIARDRSERAIEGCVSRITGEQGDGVGRVVVFRDVTWRKRLEKQFRQAKKMEAVGRVAGGVAHALNNLMTVVLGHSDLMLDGMKPGAAFFENAQAIKRSATRTATLTQKLLAFGRKQILALRPLDVNAVVGGVEQVCRHMRGGIRLELILEPLLGPTSADSDQLEEAVLTLVRNACEAMPYGGRVTIQTANVELGQDYSQDHPEVTPGRYVLLAVSDTGVGMTQDAIGHLFEPFHSRAPGIGAGLGLAAAYGFVKQCGGDIEVRSQPDKGTTFRIYLPRQAVGSEAGQPPA
jgi:hypothetical protein